jgi:hypothetical protein
MSTFSRRTLITREESPSQGQNADLRRKKGTGLLELQASITCRNSLFVYWPVKTC